MGFPTWRAETSFRPAGGVDWVPTRDLPRELLIAANKGRFGAGRRPAYAARTRDGASTGFAVDSPLEEDGFELPVPGREGVNPFR